MPPNNTQREYRRGVVICIRDEQDRWLMMRRSIHVTRAPGKIAFPGGEVNPNESYEQAAVREAKEELGIEVCPDFCAWKHTWEETGWILQGWIANWVSGNLTPDPQEVGEILWLRSDEAIDHPDGLPTIPSLIRALRQTRDPA